MSLRIGTPHAPARGRVLWLWPMALSCRPVLTQDFQLLLPWSRKRNWIETGCSPPPPAIPVHQTWPTRARMPREAPAHPRCSTFYGSRLAIGPLPRGRQLLLHLMDQLQHRLPSDIYLDRGPCLLLLHLLRLQLRANGEPQLLADLLRTLETPQVRKGLELQAHPLAELQVDLPRDVLHLHLPSRLPRSQLPTSTCLRQSRCQRSLAVATSCATTASRTLRNLGPRAGKLIYRTLKARGSMGKLFSGWVRRSRACVKLLAVRTSASHSSTRP